MQEYAETRRRDFQSQRRKLGEPSYWVGSSTGSALLGNVRIMEERVSDDPAVYQSVPHTISDARHLTSLSSSTDDRSRPGSSYFLADSYESITHRTLCLFSLFFSP